MHRGALGRKLRPDLLDHMAAPHERHLKRLLSEYEDAELTARDRGSAPTSAPRTSKPVVQRDRLLIAEVNANFVVLMQEGCSDCSAHPA